MNHSKLNSNYTNCTYIFVMYKYTVLKYYGEGFMNEHG